jgi:hypothetical protein
VIRGGSLDHGAGSWTVSQTGARPVVPLLKVNFSVEEFPSDPADKVYALDRTAL